MDIAITCGPHLRKAGIDHSGAAVRGHFRLGILVHAVDSDACSALHLRPDRHTATDTHGVNLALGVSRNIDGWMSGGVRRIDIRIVQTSEAVLVHIRNSSPALEVEEILAPIHTKAGAHGNDAGLFQFIIVILLAILGRYFNLSVIRRGDIGMVDFRPQSLLIAGRTHGSIGHSTADAHFLAAYGYTASHSSHLRQFLSRNGKFLNVFQFSFFACSLAVDDAFRVVHAPVDSHSSHGTRKGLADIHVHSTCHGQSFALVRRREFDGVIRTVLVQSDRVPSQICSGGVVKRIVCQRQPHGHALASRYFASNIDDGSLVLCLFADIFTRNGIVGKGDLGIILQVIPAAGAGSVEGLAANGHTCSDRDNGGVAGCLAVHRICRDGGAFDIRSDVVLHIVIGYTRTNTHVLIPAPAYGGGNGETMIFAQFVLGIILILGSVPCNLALVGILDVIIQGRCRTSLVEIAFPCGIKARVIQGFLVVFLGLLLFVQGRVRLFF